MGLSFERLRSLELVHPWLHSQIAFLIPYPEYTKNYVSAVVKPFQFWVRFEKNLRKYRRGLAEGQKFHLTFNYVVNCSIKGLDRAACNFSVDRYHCLRLQSNFENENLDEQKKRERRNNNQWA
jgi:hypothetical protein